MTASSSSPYAAFAPGALVRARGREWVVLPADPALPEVLQVRPLSGPETEATGLLLPLEGAAIEPAAFDPPALAHLGDSASLGVLRDAVRLTFRAGAGPFRSFGRIAVEPRAYQLVPLLMALRLDPVRLLIADDVGIGKTVEAALIARELLDRGEVRRLAVLCPPHLCDQWQQELREKFAIDAVSIRPGTVAALERPIGLASVFEAYPAMVISLDYVKSEARRPIFLRHCPELVIVDEAHTCAASPEQRGQHQRHMLVSDIAADPRRHLILTTATPHSGVEAAFRSLLTLLDPAFAGLADATAVDDADPLQRRLAQHLIQRRRQDISSYLDATTLFPRRHASEVPYAMSERYRAVFDDVRAYASELVRQRDGLNRHQQRMRWWAALGLLRCVVSSPAAGAAALRQRLAAEADDGDIDDALRAQRYQRTLLDQSEDDSGDVDDSLPAALPGAERGRQSRLGRLAQQLEALGDRHDTKFDGLVELLTPYIARGVRPIVFCRYIATATYVAARLRQQLARLDVTVKAVTGMQSAAERAEQIEALAREPRRVLVTTDCLSEGINLQQHFDMVVHYDLSWNPTRHEQREGRVDRFGQPCADVHAVLYYGNNPIDGKVLEVLLAKARTIRERLGVSVPVPFRIDAVLEAIFESLFLNERADSRQQAFVFDAADETLRRFDEEWRVAEVREAASRTRFNQLAIRPELVRRALDDTALALGDHRTVFAFVSQCGARLGAPLRQVQPAQAGMGAVYELPLADALLAPDGIALRSHAGVLRLGFALPLPAGVEHVARTHPLVDQLCQRVMADAFGPGAGSLLASRCAAYRSALVATRTTLVLLRVRMQLDVYARDGTPGQLLVETTCPVAWRGRGAAVEWLGAAEAEQLLVAPPLATLETRERRVREALADLVWQQSHFEQVAEALAAAALEQHRQVRTAARGASAGHAIRPMLPVDVLALVVLDAPAPQQ
jgi:superfamily II DNA or RNA helicase